MREPHSPLIERGQNRLAAPATVDAEFRSLEPRRASQPDLWRYWKLVRRRWTLIAAVPVALAAMTFVHDSIATALYTATATVLVKTRAPQVFYTDQQSNEENPPSASLTEYELLKSRSLAERVVLSEGLVHYTAFEPKSKSQIVPRWLRDIAANLHRLTSPKPTLQEDKGLATGGQSPPVRTAIDQYLSELKINPVEGTELVKIGVTNPDPQMAARLANAHAREFILWGIGLNAQAGEQAEKFLQTKLGDLKTQLEASEAAVNDYRRANGIIPGLISSGDEKTDLVLARLDKLSEEAQEAHLKTITLQTELSTATSGEPDAIPSIASSAPIQALKQKLDEYRAEYVSLQDRFTPDYPKMAQLRAGIAATKQTLNEEIEAATEATRAQYLEAKSREQAIDADLDQQKSFALGLNNAAVRYGILQREADTNRQLYNAVLKRMKDVTLVSDLHASNVSVVDEAEPPLSPSSPRSMLDLVVAMVIGLVAGIGLTFLLEQLDDTFGDQQDVEECLGCPILAMIPEFLSAQGLAYGGRIGQLQHNGANGGPDGRSLASYGGYSMLSEAFRTLRTSIQLSRAGSHPRSTLITSAIPKDGKTTVAVNTAIVLAHTGRRVLLIDGDLRRPNCHLLLGLGQDPGLTEVLIGQRTLNEAVQGSQFANLFLLASGLQPPNPSELLGSETMKELLRGATEQYDYVLLDSPPAEAVSDAILLSTLADGVVLVIRERYTPKHLVRNVLSRLDFARARLFGVAVNRVTLANGNSMYYAGYYSTAGYYGDPERPRPPVSGLSWRRSPSSNPLSGKMH
jgi:polysaccharide biosynthesis transport protein